MSRSASISLEFLANLDPARAKYESFIKEIQSKPINVPLTVGGGNGPSTAESATFGAPGGAVARSTTGDAAQRVYTATVSRMGTGFQPIWGPVGASGGFGGPPNMPAGPGSAGMPWGSASPNWSYLLSQQSQSIVQGLSPTSSPNWSYLLGQQQQQAALTQPYQRPIGFGRLSRVGLVGTYAAAHALGAAQEYGAASFLAGNDQEQQAKAITQYRDRLLSLPIVGGAYRYLEDPTGIRTASVQSTLQSAKNQESRSNLDQSNRRYFRSLSEAVDSESAGSGRERERLRVESEYKTRAQDIADRRANVAEANAKQVEDEQKRLASTRDERIAAFKTDRFNIASDSTSQYRNTRQFLADSIDQADRSAVASLRKQLADKYDPQFARATANADELRRLGLNEVARDYNATLARDAASTRRPFYELSRNSFGSLSSQFGAEATGIINSGASVEDRRRLLGQSVLRFGAEAALIGRNNAEASYDVERSNLAARQLREGYSLESSLTRIETNRQQQLLDIGGTGYGILDRVLGFTRRRDAVNAGAGEQIAAARQDEARRLIGVQGFITAGRYGLHDQPLNAQLTEINTRYDQLREGVTNPQRLGELGSSQAVELLQAQQQFNNQTKLINIGQKYTSLGLDRLLAYDPTGAQAAAITGSSISQANQYAFSGRPAQAETERGIGLKNLDLLKRNYLTGFEGVETDPSYIRRPAKDMTDPLATLDEIGKRQQELKTAKLGSDPGEIPDILKRIEGLFGGLAANIMTMATAE